MNGNGSRFWFLGALTLFAVASRLLPHPYNFTPIAAVALFGAATFARRGAAMLVPLIALVLSDVLLHATYLAGLQPNWGFYPGQWVVYACVLATIGLGFLIRGHRNIGTIAAATLASSILFYLVTNFAYIYGPDSIYPRTLDGLIQGYVAAIPFFARSLAGDVFYTTLLFGALALAEARFPQLRAEAKEPFDSLAALS
jgi:hypothetical protein